MDEKLSGVSKEWSVSLPPEPTTLKLDSADSECKKQNCLCAPTTHAGSFRCRLHRLPPPSPAAHNVKKGSSAQKALAPKVKVGLQQRLKQGYSKRTPSSSFSLFQQDKPGLSRLGKISLANEQNPPLQSDQEALTVLWKTSSTAATGEDALHHMKHVESSKVDVEKLSSSSSKRYTCPRPLIRLPSI